MSFVGVSLKMREIILVLLTILNLTSMISRCCHGYAFASYPNPLIHTTTIHSKKIRNVVVLPSNINPFLEHRLSPSSSSGLDSSTTTTTNTMRSAAALLTVARMGQTTDPNPIEESTTSASTGSSTTTSSFNDTAAPSATSTSTSVTYYDEERVPEIIPITVLSGFLGSGKTTLLQKLLNNKSKQRIAIIVNDVASLNIDSKYIRNRLNQNQNKNEMNEDNNISAAYGIVELQNGCACCSRSEELLSSVAELITLNDLRTTSAGLSSETTGDSNVLGPFQHIVIEMSGVADPRSVRSLFQNAMYYNMPLLERVKLDTMITVVDSTTYLQYLQSPNLVSKQATPELFGTKEIKTETDDDTFSDNENTYEDDFELDDIPMALRKSLGLFGDDDDDDNTDSVAALLTSQTEIADIVIMNKMDLIQSETTTTNDEEDIQHIIRLLNPNARIMKTSYGDIEPIESILAIHHGADDKEGQLGQHQGIANTGIIDDHRDFIQATTAAEEERKQQQEQQHHHHDHHDSHSSTSSDTKPILKESNELVCTDPTHDHTHHSHEHQHHKDHLSDKKSNNHDVSQQQGCDDVLCNDPTHDHSHSHEHATTTSTSSTTSTHAGIGTFVYTARRPFHPERLVRSLFYNLPIQLGLPGRDGSRAKAEGVQHDQLFSAESIPTATSNVLRRILRSKGFLWLANSHLAALYCSHAGVSITLSCLGAWWATLPRSQWPSHVIESILYDYDDIHHVDDNHNGNANDHAEQSYRTVGDRRQELVFIGTQLGDPLKQKLLQQLLDDCLLTDTEYELYDTNRWNEQQLQQLFPLDPNLMVIDHNVP